MDSADRARLLAASREEARRLQTQPLNEVTPSRRDFTQFVATQKEDLAVIARLAPGGSRWSAAQLVEHARTCDDADVAALAVATGAGGLTLADMAAIAAATTAPILRDDLLIDPSQIYAARLHGADAAVFPVAELDSAALRELTTVASSLHMASVIEVLNEADSTAVLLLPHIVIGLRCSTPSGALDLQRTQEVARRIPPQRTVVCLQEVRTAAECAALRGLCDAVVVGEALMDTGDVAGTLQRLAKG